MHAPNLIHGLTFDIAFDGAAPGGDALAAWLRQVLLPVLEDVLTQQQGARRIDRLELDLGTVGREDADTELPRRLFAQLSSAMGWNEDQATESSVVAAREQKASEQLLGFLRSGRLAWSTVSDQRTAHHALLRKVLAMSDAAGVLRLAVQDGAMLTRLVRQFDAALLLEVVALLSATHPQRAQMMAQARGLGNAAEAAWRRLLQDIAVAAAGQAWPGAAAIAPPVTASLLSAPPPALHAPATPAAVAHMDATKHRRGAVQLAAALAAGDVGMLRELWPEIDLRYRDEFRSAWAGLPASEQRSMLQLLAAQLSTAEQDLLVALIRPIVADRRNDAGTVHEGPAGHAVGASSPRQLGQSAAAGRVSPLPPAVPVPGDGPSGKGSVEVAALTSVDTPGAADHPVSIDELSQSGIAASADAYAALAVDEIRDDAVRQGEMRMPEPGAQDGGNSGRGQRRRTGLPETDVAPEARHGSGPAARYGRRAADAAQDADPAPDTDAVLDSDAAQDADAAQDTDAAQDADLAQDSYTAQDTYTAQETDAAQDIYTAQETDAAQDTDAAEDADPAQETYVAQDADPAQNTYAAENTYAAQDADVPQDADPAQDTDVAQDTDAASPAGIADDGVDGSAQDSMERTHTTDQASAAVAGVGEYLHGQASEDASGAVQDMVPAVRSDQTENQVVERVHPGRSRDDDAGISGAANPDGGYPGAAHRDAAAGAARTVHETAIAQGRRQDRHVGHGAIPAAVHGASQIDALHAGGVAPPGRGAPVAIAASAGGVADPRAIANAGLAPGGDATTAAIVRHAVADADIVAIQQRWAAIVSTFGAEFVAAWRTLPSSERQRNRRLLAAALSPSAQLELDQLLQEADAGTSSTPGAVTRTVGAMLPARQENSTAREFGQADPAAVPGGTDAMPMREGTIAATQAAGKQADRSMRRKHTANPSQAVDVNGIGRQDSGYLTGRPALPVPAGPDAAGNHSVQEAARLPDAAVSSPVVGGDVHGTGGAAEPMPRADRLDPRLARGVSGPQAPDRNPQPNAPAVMQASVEQAAAHDVSIGKPTMNTPPDADQPPSPSAQATVPPGLSQPALVLFREWQNHQRELSDLALSLPELKQWLTWWLMHDARLVNQDCSLMLQSIESRCAVVALPEAFMKQVLTALRGGKPLDLDVLAEQAAAGPAPHERPVAMDAITTLTSQQAIRNFVNQNRADDPQLRNLNSAQLHQLVRSWTRHGGASVAADAFLKAIEEHALSAGDAHAYFSRILHGLLEGSTIDLELQATAPVAVLAWPSLALPPAARDGGATATASPLPPLVQARLPARLADSFLHGDLKPLEGIWPELVRHHAELLSAAAHRYVRGEQGRLKLVARCDPAMLLALLKAMSPQAARMVEPLLQQAEACRAVLPQPLPLHEFHERVLAFGLAQAMEGLTADWLQRLLATLAPGDAAVQVAHAWRAILPGDASFRRAVFGPAYLAAARQYADNPDTTSPLETMLTLELWQNYPELVDEALRQRLATLPVPAAAVPDEPLLAMLLMRAEPPGTAGKLAAGLLLRRLLDRQAPLAGELESALSQPAAIERLAAMVPGAVLAELLARLAPELAAQLPGVLNAMAPQVPVANVPAMQGTEMWQRIYQSAFVAADPVTPEEFMHVLAQSVGVTGPLPSPVASPTPAATLQQLLQPLTRPAPEAPPSAALPDDAMPFTGEANILNAGMVIFATYMQRLFNILELTRDGAFVSDDAAQRAVHLLQYAVNGETETPEYQLVLNKLFCGIHGGLPIVRGIEITDKEKNVIEQMLNGVIAHWSALGKTSIAGLRETFLQRQGHLYFEEEAWHLKIPQATFDMLLDRLPWSFAMIRFPWMEYPLHVSWR